MAALEALWDDAGASGSRTAFMMGHFAAHHPDEPANIPSPPWLRVLVSAAGAALYRLADRARSPRGRFVASVLVAVPFAIAANRLESGAARRRALRMGLRRTEVPPPRVDLAQVPLAWAIAFARRRDAKRRGVWPPSLATLVGAQCAHALENERRWRSDLREWRASYQRGPLVSRSIDRR